MMKFQMRLGGGDVVSMFENVCSWIGRKTSQDAVVGLYLYHEQLQGGQQPSRLFCQLLRVFLAILPEHQNILVACGESPVSAGHIATFSFDLHAVGVLERHWSSDLVS